MKRTNERNVHRAVAALAAGALAGFAGCAHRVTVDPIRVEPIHLTLDITLKVDRELDQFFDFQETPPAAPAGDGGAS
jgi:hypothetical protein